ncbi:MAG: signal transduction histidine kinase [Zhongshania aliphaticivorans]|jgi:signal transduction histidine kinase|uniref:response regulator n=1 Tax=Zhongshania aliphaticivorans TaxID=1470434 RepID=UPI0039E6EC37
MNVSHYFKKNTIFRQILIAVLSPALILFLALFGYSLFARLNDAVQSQNELAKRIAENIASVSELAIISGSDAQLLDIMASALDSDITSITIFNAESGHHLILNNNQSNSIDHNEITVPIIQHSIPLADSITGENISEVEEKTIGTVSIKQSRDKLLKLQRQIIKVSSFIAFISILVCICFAWFISRRFSQPLAEIISLTKNITAGNFYKQIRNIKPGELGELQSHVNNMARSIEKQQQELKDNLQNLLQAKEEADKANLAKSQFLATMTHELRTPLNGALGMMQLLSNTQLNAEQNHYLLIARESSELLLNIVNNILDFSEIEKGELQLQEKYFDINAIFDNLLTPLSYEAKKKGLEFTAHIDPQLKDINVLGDDVRIRQILLNLVANAVKFTPQGSVTIALNALQLTGKQAILELKVTDTGIGISEKDQQIIFDSFRQADGSHRRKYGGSGLGLAIVRRLCDLMNADISLTSTENKGSAFTIRWSCPYQISSDLEHHTLQEETLLAGKTVLIVEDNPINQLLVSKILRRWGMTTVTTDNGAEALIAIEKQRFDIILMDLQMPVMDGFEATQAIRRHAQYRHTPIIALTANNFKDDSDYCFRVGMNDFLSKPVSLTNLKEKIRFWLSKSLGISLSESVDKGPE